MRQNQTVHVLDSNTRSGMAAVRRLGRQLRDLAQQRVWLPRLIYESLPVLYIVLGVVAVLSALFNRHWSWVVPHVFLLGCFLLHLGTMVWRRRQRARSGGAAPAS